MTAPARTVRVPRGAVIAVAVVAAALLAGLAGGRPHRDGPPLDPRSDAPLGTSALVALLRGLDAEVDLSVGLPTRSDDVAVLLQDRLDAEQRDELRAWVAAGRTLVVTDPGSPLAPVPLAVEGAADEGPIGRGTCTIEALRDVGEVDGGQPVRYDALAADGGACFTQGRGAFVTRAVVGSGEVVAVGGAAFLTNDLLDEVDNAVLAAALMAPTAGTRVRVVDAPVPAGGGTKTLGDLVPGGLRRALVQLGIAFIAYAIWRSVRLGRPVPEDPPVPIAGSELVAAVGRLLGRTRSASAAGETLRSELRRRLRSRFGVGPDADPTVLAAVVAARSGHTEDEILAATDHRPIASEADLVAVARSVSSINQEVLR